MSDLKPAHEALSPIFGETRTIYHLEYTFPWSEIRESDWARALMDYDAATEAGIRENLALARKNGPVYLWRAVKVTEIKEMVKE